MQGRLYDSLPVSRRKVLERTFIPSIVHSFERTLLQNTPLFDYFPTEAIELLLHLEFVNKTINLRYNVTTEFLSTVLILVSSIDVDVNEKTFSE